MSDYSLLDRLVHRLILGSPAVAEILHDIERSRYLKDSPPFDGQQHVFVTGLARAGTTMLMRELFATGAFGSLAYTDMPAVLAPNLWASLPFKNSQHTELAERAHGDGIKVNVDSPEALDEVYWRVCSGKSYITDKGLIPHNPDADTLSGYQDLIRLILRKTGKTRYLSKNNNNLLRLRTLAESWPSAVFFVPIRHPLDHARSLMGQHKRFLETDKFTKAYMSWLAHHEFGATHKPYLFGKSPLGDPTQLDYWLSVWIEAHSYVRSLLQNSKNIFIVPHEDFCSDPTLWKAILSITGLPESPWTEIRKITAPPIPEHSTDLAKKAANIHLELRNYALTHLRIKV